MSKMIALLGVYLPIALSQLAMAQSGVVKSQGQTIPGVTVKATMAERALTTVTDENGAFQFTGLTPGTWTIEADMFGFNHLSKDVPITATPTSIDLDLQLAARAEPVRPQPAQLTQRGQGRGAVPEEPALEAAPPADLAQAAPEGTNDAFLVNGTVSTGLQTNNNDFRPDGGGFGPGGFPGGPGGDFGPGGPGNGEPGGGGPQAAQGGGRNGRGNFNAGGGFPGGGGFGGGGRGGGGGFGGGGGRGGGGRGGRGGRQQGLIGNRSRQGANQIRINIFDTFGDSVLNARSFSTSGQSAAKPSYMSNRYGVNIGGPLIIPHLFDLGNKLNFTLNYNGTVQKAGVDDVATLPTAAERLGDFSAISNQIYVPGTRTQFANNQIPATSLDPIALKLLTLIPLPNQPGILQNYRFITAVPTNLQQVSFRLQYTLTPKDRLSLTVQTQHTGRTNAQVFGYLDTFSVNGQNESIQWTHNFTARFFNSLTVGLNRNSSLGTPFFEGSAINDAALGIAGPVLDPRNFGPPVLSFTNYGSLLGDAYPTQSVTQTGNANESLTWRRGKHNLQFGALFNRYDINQLTDSATRGTFQFTGAGTSLIGADGLAAKGTGYDLADFLLGLPASTTLRPAASNQYLRGIGYSFFAQDDWRLSSTISLNFGLRYEYTSPFSEKYGHLANINLGPGFSSATVVTAGAVALPGVIYGPNGFPGTLVNPDRNNFGPRVAIAWRASKKGNLVIRTGYGMYYNEGVYNQIAQRLSVEPPFTSAANTVQTSPTNPLNLANGLIGQQPGQTITNAYAISRNFPDTYISTWNFGIQRDLPGNLVMQLTYTGSKGTRLPVYVNANQALPGSTVDAASRVPLSNAGEIQFEEPVGNSILNQGQVQFIRRMRNNLSFQLSYTLTSAFDDASGALVLNPADIAAERAWTTGDSKHNVAFTWTFQSPVDGRKGLLSNKGFLTKALKDWTFNNTTSFLSGKPFTPTVSGDIAGIGNLQGLTQRAQATGLPVDSGSGYFNGGAFLIPASGTFGNAGRNVIFGPDQFTTNLNFSRTFAFKERKSLEVQINSTNPINHVNISSFGTVVNGLGYGIPTAAAGMRTINMTLRFRM